MFLEEVLVMHVRSVTGKDIDADTELMGEVMSSFEFISFLQKIELITGEKFRFDRVDFSRAPTIRLIVQGVVAS